MRKIIYTIFLVLFCTLSANANLATENEIQTRIDTIGTNILNSNKIQSRVIFTYNKKTGKAILKKGDKFKGGIIIMYDGAYQYAENDDEIAAFISMSLYRAGKLNKRFGSKLNSFIDPKHFEFIADKKAVDYMVNAKYNPLALITYMNKTCPERKISLRQNKTSKRMLEVYEYTLLKYPKYMEEDNPYLNNRYYQNFLLNTTYERGLIHDRLYKKGAEL